MLTLLKNLFTDSFSCHSVLDRACHVLDTGGSSLLLDSRFRGNDGRGMLTYKLFGNLMSFLKISLLIGILVLTGISGCSKKEVKHVSEESKIAQEAFGLAETIRDAYIRTDRATLERNSTKDGYRELIGAIKSFDSAELTFTFGRVEIEGSVAYLHVLWKGTWIVNGKRTEDRGMAIFVLEGRPLKLAQVLRANPFRQPE